MEIKYLKDEVWLCLWAGGLTPITILEINGGYVRHKYGWEDDVAWNIRAKQKLGTVRRFLGIKVGISKVSERIDHEYKALFGLSGHKGWRYRLLHWLCARWGYFPIPWDAVENADHDARIAADEATADDTMTNRAAAGHALLNRISAEQSELAMWRSGRDDWARPLK